MDVVPEKSRAEGVFDALEAYLGGREQFEGLNFLLPRAAVARDFLPRALEEAGRARATSSRPTAPSAPRRPTARASRRCSSAAASTASPSPAPRPCTTSRSSSTRATSRPLLSGVRVACIGAVTAETAAEYGLRADIVPAESNARALARAVAEFYYRAPVERVPDAVLTKTFFLSRLTCYTRCYA